MIKNYVILLLVTIMFILVAWGLINQYAQSKKEQTIFVEHEIAEIKVNDLKNYLLETPNTIILLIFDNNEKELLELVMILSEHNIIQNVVYLDVREPLVEDRLIIEEKLSFSFAKVAEENLILIIDDFKLVDKMYVADGEDALIDFFQEWNYIDD